MYISAIPAVNRLTNKNCMPRINQKSSHLRVCVKPTDYLSPRVTTSPPRLSKPTRERASPSTSMLSHSGHQKTPHPGISNPTGIMRSRNNQIQSDKLLSTMVRILSFPPFPLRASYPSDQNHKPTLRSSRRTGSKSQMH